MKRTNQVFAEWMIDTRFAADACVNLSYDRGGNWNEGQSPEADGGDKTANIARNAATKSDHQTFAVEACGQEVIQYPGDRVKRFVFLAGLDDLRDNVETRRLKTR